MFETSVLLKKMKTKLFKKIETSYNENWSLVGVQRPLDTLHFLISSILLPVLTFLKLTPKFIFPRIPFF